MLSTTGTPKKKKGGRIADAATASAASAATGTAATGSAATTGQLPCTYVEGT